MSARLKGVERRELRRRLAARREECRASIVAAFVLGDGVAQIAIRHGVTSFAVRAILSEAGLLKPVAAQRLPEPVKAVMPPPVQVRIARQPDYEVPAWVPLDLVGTFHSIARKLGEEAAASTVRRMKAEVARSRDLEAAE